jgi:hypothetical protein
VKPALNTHRIDFHLDQIPFKAGFTVLYTYTPYYVCPRHNRVCKYIAQIVLNRIDFRLVQIPFKAGFTVLIYLHTLLCRGQTVT